MKPTERIPIEIDQVWIPDHELIAKRSQLVPVVEIVSKLEVGGKGQIDAPGFMEPVTLQ